MNGEKYTSAVCGGGLNLSPTSERTETVSRLVAASDVLVISRSNIKVLWASVTVELMLVRHLANSLLALPRLSESEKGDQQWYSENLEHVDNGTECYTSKRPTLG